MRWARLGELARRRIAWAAVLAANLPVPALFGLLISEEGGRVGMTLGVGLVWLLGHECCRWYPRATEVAIVGGWAVAVSQVFPALQMVAGSLSLRALTLGTAARRDLPPTVAGPLLSFAATILTGGMLLIVAVVLGLAIRALLSAGRPRDVGKPEIRWDELD